MPKAVSHRLLTATDRFQLHGRWYGNSGRNLAVGTSFHPSTYFSFPLQYYRPNIPQSFTNPSPTLHKFRYWVSLKKKHVKWMRLENTQDKCCKIFRTKTTAFSDQSVAVHTCVFRRPSPCTFLIWISARISNHGERAQIVDFYTASLKETPWQSLTLSVQGCNKVGYNG